MKEPSGPLQGQTSIFRVHLKKDKPAEPVYHPRRPHQKSRSGCWNCKRRRVKCDESKPHCERCQKHGAECDYAALQRYPHKMHGVITEFLERLPYLASLDSNGYSMALQAAARTIDELLQIKPSKNRRRYDGLIALQYFHNGTLPSQGLGNMPPLVKGRVLELGFQSPFLMHALIATTTTHLCHIVPDNTSYKAIEAYHWREAVSQYSTEISSAIGPGNMDALISACLLLTMNSFMLEEFNPLSSFVFSNNREALNWLMLQSGLRHLLHLTEAWFPQSLWFDSFMASRGEESSFEDHRRGRDGLDPEMADLCGIGDESDDANPYWWPLRMLAHIVPIERSIRSFVRYTNFVGRLMPEYYEKLLQRDPPALVILAWWLALMSFVPVWWIGTRVRSECVAICLFLENGDDPRVLRLLEFPAQTCGYLLRHVGERDVLVDNTQ